MLKTPLGPIRDELIAYIEMQRSAGKSTAQIEYILSDLDDCKQY